MNIEKHTRSVKSTWNLRCHKGMTMIRYTDYGIILQIIHIVSIIDELRLIKTLSNQKRKKDFGEGDEW